MYTLSNIHDRYNYLIGETTTLANDTNGVAQINSSIKDILNRAPFNWSIGTETLTLSSGISNIDSTFNRQWGIQDARIVNSGTGDDYVFTEIPVRKRDSYDSDSYVYWLTYSSGVYVFNSLTQSGSVVVYYNIIPADLAAATPTGICIVPDGEAVAYLAASKNWVADERNLALSKEFSAEAEKRIKNMIANDLNFGPQETVGSVLDYNPQVTGGYKDDLTISKT